MTTTKIQSNEYIKLNKKIKEINQIKKEKINNKETIRLLKIQRNIIDKQIILKQNNILILKNKKNILKSKILNGGTKHQEIAHYIIKILNNNKLNYNTETGIYLKDINKIYKVDILANKNIAIECGNTKKSKLKDLKNHYFNIIHISYGDFKILKLAEQINNRINEVIKYANEET